METLGDDLVLLSIRSDGVIGTATKLRFGLSGSELVRLAALRRVDIERGRIVIRDRTPTGDVLLDEALASMASGRRSPSAKSWVQHKRGDLAQRYLERLANAGTIRAGQHKVLGFIPSTRWTVLDAERLAAARGRLDAITYGSGSVNLEQAALAGLAGAIGLASLIYPGFAGRAARKKLEAAGKSGGAATHATKRAVDAASASQTSIDAATQAAVSATVQAATQAAVQASIDAATQAAVSAATEAAHHAASDAGHAGGGHH
jgi:pectate lyase/MAP7 domain-containing protein 3